MTTAMREQIKWCTYGLEPNPLVHIDPLRPIVQWYNTRRMNGYINKVFGDRYSVNRDDVSGKTIVDLALKAYWDESQCKEKVGKMDSTFHEFAVSQIKLFIFAGHDTTASTICYVYHLLSLHRSALIRLRAEHDAVFGPNLTETDSLIASKPHLLNQIPYTLAIIKETLRLFPVVTIPRAGQSDFFLTDPEGRQYPTEGCLVWGVHHGLHRNPRWWPHPEQFLPERWLVEADHPLYPMKNAWRPFERGPRACIGQELAIMEIKMILAMTVREFDVCGVYAEWDQVNRRGQKNVKSVEGERAYQIQLGSAHPSDGFPCRVTWAESSGSNGMA
jgi:cytochrome P450